MKKLTATIIAALALLVCWNTAFAVDKPTITITPLDYQTGRVIAAKEYNEGENFCLRVDVDIPRFADTANMEKKLEYPGVTLYQDTVEMKTGTYYITGMVGQQPACVAVCFKDYSYDRAETAEQLYLAQQQDKTVCAAFRFTAAAEQQTAQQQNPNIVIPRTGDMPLTFICVVAICLSAALYYLARRQRNV